MPQNGPESSQMSQLLQSLPQAPQLELLVRSVSHGVLHVPKPAGQVVVPPVHVPLVQVGVLAGQSASVQHCAQPSLHMISPPVHVAAIMPHAPASVQKAVPALSPRHAPEPHAVAHPVAGVLDPLAVHVDPQRWKPAAQSAQSGPVIPVGHVVASFPGPLSDPGDPVS
jgi:hypothetical protein